MRTLTILLITLFITSCSKETENGGTLQLQFVSTSIKGITKRDMNGALLGPIDVTDWNTNDLFPASINANFNFTDTLDYTGADTSTVDIVCYPNPFQQIVALQINSSNATIFKLLLIDEANTIYMQHSFALHSGGNPLIYDLTDANLQPNKLYRLYYKFYNQQKKNYASGHGELQKM
jgi:hypothetical protein